MKQLSKVWIVLLALILSADTGYSQIIVRVRPPRPKVVVVTRPAPPTPRHVWVEEDWRPRGRRYVWYGGHYVAPPRPAAVWVPGHWERRRHGEVWVRGYWR